jgi:hypothetical protein
MIISGIVNPNIPYGLRSEKGRADFFLPVWRLTTLKKRVFRDLLTLIAPFLPDPPNPEKALDHPPRIEYIIHAARSTPRSKKLNPIDTIAENRLY